MSSDRIHNIARNNIQTVSQLEAKAHRDSARSEKLADAVVGWVGSWTFLIIQSVLLILWMAANIAGWYGRWDPYPFVLLNLALSFQAAFSTPMILMSENRQARISEQRNNLDLQINLLAEQENSEQLKLLRLICERLKISVDLEEEQAYEEATNPVEIVDLILQSRRDKPATSVQVPESPHG